MNRTSKTSSTIVAPRRDLCIDFANTRYSRGSEPVETVHDFSEMVRWCGTNARLGREAAEHALQWSEKHGRDAAAIFDDAIALRETIYRICFAMADGKTPEARDVAAINAALDRTPERRVLAHRETTFGWRIDRDPVSTAGLLAPVKIYCFAANFPFEVWGRGASVGAWQKSHRRTPPRCAVTTTSSVSY